MSFSNLAAYSELCACVCVYTHHMQILKGRHVSCRRWTHKQGPSPSSVWCKSAKQTVGSSEIHWPACQASTSAQSAANKQNTINNKDFSESKRNQPTIYFFKERKKLIDSNCGGRRFGIFKALLFKLLERAGGAGRHQIHDKWCFAFLLRGG